MNGYGEPFNEELGDDDVARLRSLLDLTRELTEASDPLVQAHAVGVSTATRAVLVHLGLPDA